MNAIQPLMVYIHELKLLINLNNISSIRRYSNSASHYRFTIIMNNGDKHDVSLESFVNNILSNLCVTNSSDHLKSLLYILKYSSRLDRLSINNMLETLSSFEHKESEIEEPSGLEF